MSVQCCSTCRFAQVKGSKFECHAAPPPTISLVGDPPEKPKAHWPKTESTDWCGRWALGTPRP